MGQSGSTALNLHPSIRVGGMALYIIFSLKMTGFHCLHSRFQCLCQCLPQIKRNLPLRTSALQLLYEMQAKEQYLDKYLTRSNSNYRP